MRFCCNVLKDFIVIGIAMNFLGNKFSFKLIIYFMKGTNANIKNKMWAPKNFLTFFFIGNSFDFSIKFINIVGLDRSKKSHLFYKKKLQSLN